MAEPRMSILKEGTILNDKWLIMGLIGQGGMGEVYHAYQLNLKRDVAIKVISQEWLQISEEELGDPESVLQRFHREFQVMAQVRHPNIIQIYDNGSSSIQKGDKEIAIEYIVMEYIPGATLRFTMSEDGFEPDEKLIREWITSYFLPVLDGVQALHSFGIVHRDLKPENILLDGAIPKITDFGLARSFRLQPLSRTADAQGTLTYMSPEQFIDFKRVDHRGDIYSLGRILFEAVSGKISKETLPFKQVKLANPSSPFFQKLDQIIQKASAEDRDHRLDTVEKMRDLLLEAMENIKKQEKSDSGTSEASSKWVHPKWIWGGIFVTFFAILLMVLWHFAGDFGLSKWLGEMVGKNDQYLSENKKVNPGHSPAEPIEGEPATMLGEDGITMVLVRGGNLITNPNNDKQTIKIQIKSFYMDEHKVSNENFVEFLNEVKENLVVEKGVVKGNGQIWFLMGEGTEPYEQIIYEHERFHLKNLQAAAQPVVRVTWYGAMAYARHYNKRLPTEDQWIFAAFHRGSAEGRFQEPGKGVIFDPTLNQDHHMGHMDYFVEEGSKEGVAPNPLSSAKPSPKKQIFLNNMGGEIKEWAIRSKTAETGAKNLSTSQGQTDYTSIILGGASLSGKSKIRSEFISNRYPWEGFPNVGFRCIVELK